MKKLALIKAAIDFSFANYALGAVELAEKSIAAFKTAGGFDDDLRVWDSIVNQQVSLAKQLSKQKLPSEQAEQQKAAPASNATAATASTAAQ